jgi:hypothetical protein
MSDFKKQWTNIPKRKKAYNSNREFVNKRGSLSEDSRVFKNNNNFPSLPLNSKLHTHTSNAFSALAWRKTDISHDIAPIIQQNTIYEKAKKGFIEFNLYPVLSTSPKFPMFQ